MMQNDTNTSAPRGGTIAVLLGASVSILAIGIFNYWSETSPAVKSFMTLSAALGPWSGKVVYGYGAGIAAWFVAWLICRKHAGNLMPWFILFVASLFVGSLLVFSPFLHLLP